MLVIVQQSGSLGEENRGLLNLSNFIEELGFQQ